VWNSPGATAKPFLSREFRRELVQVNQRFARTSPDVTCPDSIAIARDRPIVGVADLLPTQEQHTSPSRLVNR
jgi:hypothetical protein